MIKHNFIYFILLISSCQMIQEMRIFKSEALNIEFKMPFNYVITENKEIDQIKFTNHYDQEKGQINYFFVSKRIALGSKNLSLYNYFGALQQGYDKENIFTTQYDKLYEIGGKKYMSLDGYPTDLAKKEKTVKATSLIKHFFVLAPDHKTFYDFRFVFEESNQEEMLEFQLNFIESIVFNFEEDL